MKIKSFAGGFVAGMLLFLGAASATTLIVDGKSDIFLAGQSSVPAGFPANPGASGEGAGLLPLSINVHFGETLNFSATGLVSCCLGGSPTSGPDGGPSGFGLALIPGYGFVAGYSGIAFPLLGVFLTAAPTPLGATPFVIGSSLNSVSVPSGATTLYFGFADSLGFGDAPGYFNDNTGSLTLEVSGVPELSTWAMLILGFIAIGLMTCRRRSTTAVAT
jgi:hypothetical protein